MTEWKSVKGSQETKPAEIEKTYGTVYLRKNIEQIEVEDVTTEETVTLWQYDEKQFTEEEYNQYTMINESTESILAFRKQEVVDEYTLELLEEGLI